MKLRKRHLLYATGVIVTVALLAWAFMPQPVPVSADRVVRGAMRVTLDEDGEVRARDRYLVAAPVAGRLLRVHLQEGDRVRQGEIVARIAPMPLSERERGEQTARLASARALEREASQQVARIELVLEQARRDRQRTDALVAQGFLAPQTAEQARVAEATAAAELEAARHRVRSAAADVRAAEASLVATRGDARADALIEIRAPADTRVLRIPEKSERVLAGGEPIMTLADGQRLEVVLDYLTTDAVRIEPGMDVLLDNWGGEALRGRVRLVEPGGFTKVSPLGVEEQRTNVVVDFVDPPGPLGDGYRIEGRVIVWSSVDALKVPAASLFRVGTDWAVFVVSDGRAVRRRIAIGERNAIEARVLDGVNEGEMVIRHPPSELADGTRVRLRDTE